MTRRQLVAWINDSPVGILDENGGIWSFTYAREWLANPQRYPLCPSLQLSDETLLDQSTNRPVQWYFDNLLPEEGQRVLLAKEARVETADAFALLAYYGAESAGSLTLLDPNHQPDASGALHALTDQALGERIRNLPKVALTRGAFKRMSLAGAQHKLAVVLHEGELFEPEGQAPSTHILKPNHPDADYPHSAINEWYVMRLAKQLRLYVPEVHRRYVPEPLYIIDRFDRVGDISGCRRTHTLDACQLLGLDRLFKYSQGSIETLARLANECRLQAAARSRLFGWLVFNLLVGNSDAHLKNLSFLTSHDGIQLAPFYDMLSIASYETRAFDKKGWPDNTQLAWPLLGETRFSGISRELLLEAGRNLNLGKATATRLIDYLRNNILREADLLYAEVEAENRSLVETRPILAPCFEGEMRCLRTIRHAVISEMVGRF